MEGLWPKSKYLGNLAETCSVRCYLTPLGHSAYLGADSEIFNSHVPRKAVRVDGHVSHVGVVCSQVSRFPSSPFLLPSFLISTSIKCITFRTTQHSRHFTFDALSTRRNTSAKNIPVRQHEPPRAAGEIGTDPTRICPWRHAFCRGDEVDIFCYCKLRWESVPARWS